MRLLPITLALALAPLASAQDWIKQAPSPTGRDLYAAAFIDPDLGFICGVNRNLMRTRDGGETWETIFSGVFTTGPFYNVHFHDDQNGWVIGNNNGAYRTTDAGESWQQMTDIEGGSWREVVSFSPTSLVIGANGALSASTDGGLTWEVRSGYPDCPVVYGMDFQSETVGLVSGDQVGPGAGDLGIYRTTDGGRTWTKVLDKTSNDVIFMDGDRVIAQVFSELAGENVSTIWYSDDAGITWFETGVFFGEEAPDVDMERVNATTVAAISSQGAIWMSNDGGFRWTKRQGAVGTLPYSWQLHFADDLHGYAAGPRGILLATTDGGRNWDMIQNGGGFTVTDLDMFDDDFGMAAGGNYVMRTEDGGDSWDLQRLVLEGPIFGRDENVAAVDFVSRDVIVAAGAGGVVFQSFDGGQFWSQIGAPSLPPLFDIEDIDFVSEFEGWVIGDFGLYHTVDGFNWTRALDFFGIRVQFIDEDNGWMQMPGGRQFRTVNGGDTWEDRLLPNHPRFGSASVEDVHFLDENHGWVVGWWGYAIKSADGGQSWEFMDLGLPTQTILQGVKVVSPEEIWITAYDRDLSRNYVMHSTDGGRTWTEETVDQGEFTSTTEIEISPDGGVWTAGFQGEIYHKAGITCRVDIDADGVLTIFDFLAFQTGFDAGDLSLDFDGDGALTIFDFLAFQTEFDAGCE
ncbi:MAG: YCF48-related protein [Phycisphaera sp.]|nr:MAG: YCF48-related protein [Phycisphaera sp.]